MPLFFSPTGQLLLTPSGNLAGADTCCCAPCCCIGELRGFRMTLSGVTSSGVNCNCQDINVSRCVPRYPPFSECGGLHGETFDAFPEAHLPDPCAISISLEMNWHVGVDAFGDCYLTFGAIIGGEGGTVSGSIPIPPGTLCKNISGSADFIPTEPGICDMTGATLTIVYEDC